MRRRLLALLLLCLLWALPALAQVDAEASGDAAASPSVRQPAPEPQLNLPGAKSLNALHDYFSHNVERLSRQVDSFFGANRVYEESTGTYIQLRGTAIYMRGGEIDTQGKVRARLDLPNLTDRLNLLLESEQENQTPEQSLAASNGITQETGAQALATSLQYIFRRRENWDIRLQPGLRLDWPLKSFLRLRLRWLHPLSKTWLTRVTVTPGWYSDRGWEARGRYDLERSTGHDALFRASTNAVWNDGRPHNLPWSEVLLFAHPLSDRAQMAYEVGVSGDIEPCFEDQRYFSSVRYRRNIHRGWLFFEVQPQIEFTRANDFKPNPSLALTLEILFGGRYL